MRLNHRRKPVLLQKRMNQKEKRASMNVCSQTSGNAFFGGIAMKLNFIIHQSLNWS